MKSSTKENNEQVSARILEIRAKIKDQRYIDCAIERIALVLSKRLVDTGDVDKIFAV